MLDKRQCVVKTAGELDAEIRDILALQAVGREDEICGTLYIDYQDESVKEAMLISELTDRGVHIVWRIDPRQRPTSTRDRGGPCPKVR